MIRYVKGDATSPHGEGKKLIVHCVNDLGAWGAGFVLALSRKWPEPEETYTKSMLKGAPKLGSVTYVPVDDMDGADIVVANLVGQRGLRSSANPRPVQYDALERGLQSVAQYAKKHNATVHMPRIACGLAGGKWDLVSALIETHLKDLDVTVYDI